MVEVQIKVQKMIRSSSVEVQEKNSGGFGTDMNSCRRIFHILWSLKLTSRKHNVCRRHFFSRNLLTLISNDHR